MHDIEDRRLCWISNLGRTLRLSFPGICVFTSLYIIVVLNNNSGAANKTVYRRRILSTTFNAYHEPHLHVIGKVDIVNSTREFTRGVIPNENWILRENAVKFSSPESLLLRKSLFWNTLVFSAQKAGYQPPDNPLRIGNFANGYDPVSETLVLAQYFGGCDPSTDRLDLGRADRTIPPGVTAFAVDHDPDKTKFTRHSYAIFFKDREPVDLDSSGPIEIETCDLANNVASRQFLGESSFDVILFRHPGPLSNTGKWDKIITNAISLLRPGGFFLATSYIGDTDSLERLSSLRQISCETMLNPFSFSAIGDDAFVTFGIKPTP